MINSLDVLKLAK